MPRSESNLHFGYLLLAIVIAGALWGMAHGTSSIERGFDVPIAFHGVPEQVVITDQSADVVNIRVLGSRAALRDVTASKLEYPVAVEGARPGPAVYEVDVSRLDDQLPRGLRIVSRSPSRIELMFERRGRKSVRVRADLEGEPAEGFTLKDVTIDPPRVWLVGARGDVLRLSEVVTDTIDVSALEETTEHEVTLFLGGGHVWMEEPRPVKVKIAIEAVPEPEEPPAVSAEPGPTPG